MRWLRLTGELRGLTPPPLSEYDQVAGWARWATVRAVGHFRLWCIDCQRTGRHVRIRSPLWPITQAVTQVASHPSTVSPYRPPCCGLPLSIRHLVFRRVGHRHAQGGSVFKERWASLARRFDYGGTVQ